MFILVIIIRLMSQIMLILVFRQISWKCWDRISKLLGNKITTWNSFAKISFQDVNPIRDVS